MVRPLAGFRLAARSGSTASTAMPAAGSAPAASASGRSPRSGCGWLRPAPPPRRRGGPAAARAASPAVRRCRASARASRSAAWAASSFTGKTSHSMEPAVGRGHRRRRCAPGSGGGPGAGRLRTGWDGPVRRRRSSGPSSCSRLAQSDGGKRGGGLQRGIQRRDQRGPVGDQFLHPLAQAAGTGPAALGAAQPTAQFGGLDTGQRGRERAVGGVEHVVALVEDVAAWARRCRPGRPTPPASSPAHGWRRRDRRCGSGGWCARRSSGANAGRRHGCIRRGGRPAWRSGRRRTVPAASRAGRRPACRRRRSPWPSGRSGRAG